MTDQSPFAVALDRVLELVVVFNDDMTRGLAAAGLTVPRAHLLWVLKAGGPQTQQALATAVGVTPRNITGLVDGLVGTGFVSREPHPTDRRALLVRLTTQGDAVTTALADGRQELARTLFGDLDHARLETFVEVTELVVARLGAAVASAEAGGTDRSEHHHVNGVSSMGGEE